VQAAALGEKRSGEWQGARAICAAGRAIAGDELKGIERCWAFCSGRLDARDAPSCSVFEEPLLKLSAGRPAGPASLEPMSLDCCTSGGGRRRASPKSISIAAFRAGGRAGRGGREQIGRSSQIAGAQQKQGAGCRCCVAKEMQTLSLASGGGRGCPGGNVAPALVDRRTLGRTGVGGGTRRLHLAGSSRRWVEGATDRRCRCPPTALSFARAPCSVLRSDGGPGEGTGLLVPASLCWREVASGRASFKHFLRRSNPR
jgi:hypothetical protein